MSYRPDHLFSKADLGKELDLDLDVSKLSSEDLRLQWRKTMESGMHGICFSMYEDGQEPGDNITMAQVD